MRVLLTQKSEADIRRIVEYYESSGSSQGFRMAFAKAIAHLETYPGAAGRRRDLTRRDVFFWLIDPYWLILKRSGDALFVVSVSHCSRKLGPILHESLKKES